MRRIIRRMWRKGSRMRRIVWRMQQIKGGIRTELVVDQGVSFGFGAPTDCHWEINGKFCGTLHASGAVSVWKISRKLTLTLNQGACNWTLVDQVWILHKRISSVGVVGFLWRCFWSSCFIFFKCRLAFVARIEIGFRATFLDFRQHARPNSEGGLALLLRRHACSCFQIILLTLSVGKRRSDSVTYTAESNRI